METLLLEILSKAARSAKHHVEDWLPETDVMFIELRPVRAPENIARGLQCWIDVTVERFSFTTIRREV